MFSNIGGKIKVLAMVLAWLGIILSVIIGIITIRYSLIAGLLYAGIGALSSWVGSFLLYGFGELIENVTSINFKLDLRSINYNNSATNTNVWKCTSCGQENANNYGYCKHCGNPKA